VHGNQYVIYLLTGTRTPTRFFFPEHHQDPIDTRALGITPDSEMKVIVSKRPKFVIMGTWAETSSPVLSEYLRTQCSLFKTVKDLDVYRCD
jgi:hypothetical protein